MFPNELLWSWGLRDIRIASIDLVKSKRGLRGDASQTRFLFSGESPIRRGCVLSRSVLRAKVPGRNSIGPPHFWPKGIFQGWLFKLVSRCLFYCIEICLTSVEAQQTTHGVIPGRRRSRYWTTKCRISMPKQDLEPKRRLRPPQYHKKGISIQKKDAPLKISGRGGGGVYCPPKKDYPPEIDFLN